MRVLVLLVVCAGLGGCSDLGFGARTLTDLEEAARTWERTRPSSYVYAVERLCFCPVEYRGPVRVRVQGDSVVERVFVDTGDPVPSAYADVFPPVEGLFEILSDAYEGDAHEIRVTYDSATGVPLDFWIDYMEMAADEELGMRVTEGVVTAVP
ncbi:MAG: DUF6174 domain-containing protein [Longimicrobiales bacterium]